MLKTRIKSIRISIIILFLIIIAISVNLLDTNQTTVNGLVLGLLQTSIYFFLYAIWGVSVQLRISQTQARFFLQLIASLLIFWILLRGMKYYIFAEGSHICRYLWYLYYVPMLLIPLLSFFVGLSLGKPDYHRIPRWNILLFTICIILIIGVLTNDIHQLAFTFSNENLEYADSEHGFGFIYFLIYIWMLCLPAAFLFIVISKCRIPGIKKVLWLPIVPFIVAFIYSLCYNFKILRVFTDMNLVFTTTIVAIFECCIKCGLIRTNTGYIELFEAGSYGAQIINKNFKVEYSSASAIDIPYDIMCEIGTKSIKIDDNTILNSHSITNGYAIWKVDTSPLNKLIEQLKYNREAIAENVILEEKNYKAKLRINVLKEKNKLYQELQNQTEYQVKLLYELLDLYDNETEPENKNKILAMLTVVGTYIKRRGNLLFLSKKEKMLDCSDLVLCLQESASNLELLNVKSSILTDSTKEIEAKDACAVYDFFEKVIEIAIKDMSFLLVRLKFIEGRPKLQIEVECDTSFEKFSVNTDSCVLNEGVWYISKYFRKDEQ